MPGEIVDTFVGPDVMPGRVPGRSRRELERVGVALVNMDALIIGKVRANQGDHIGVYLNDIDMRDIRLGEDRLQVAAKSQAMNQHAAGRAIDCLDVVEILVAGVGHDKMPAQSQRRHCISLKQPLVMQGGAQGAKAIDRLYFNARSSQLTLAYSTGDTKVLKTRPPPLGIDTRLLDLRLPARDRRGPASSTFSLASTHITTLRHTEERAQDLHRRLVLS